MCTLHFCPPPKYISMSGKFTVIMYFFNSFYDATFQCFQISGINPVIDHTTDTAYRTSDYNFSL